MTQSISTGETPSGGTLTEVALRGMVGYLLFMTEADAPTSPICLIYT